MVEVCTAANGDRITNQYDSLKRLQKKTVEHDNSSAYTYEIQTTYQAGNETNRTTSLVQMYKYQYAGTNNFYATRYVYDNLGNIREVWRKYPNSATGGYHDEQISLYRYDDQNRLIYEENRLDGYTMLYYYDTYGNLRTKKKLASYGFSSRNHAHGIGQHLTTDTYTYGDESWKDLLTAYNGHAFTYDAIGNPLTYYNGKSYNMTWNGRQLSTLGVDGKTVSYTYDADGQRTAKTVGTDQTTYLYIGGQLCKVNNPTAGLEFFYDDDGRALGFSISSERYGYAKFYYVYNAQGDVVQLRDAANNVTANYLYDAWGKLLHICTYSGQEITDASHAALLNPIRYRGYVYDSETGLYYLNSRYYDPQLGRFVNADDSETLFEDQDDLQQYNLFTYCFNNPINMYDPDGYWTQALFEGGYLAAVTLGATNAWNLVGLVILGVLAVTALIIVGVSIYDHVKSASDNSEPDPYARPGQKKQGRERKNKARKSKDWKPRSNPKPPKKHTPGRGHRKNK